MPEIGRSIEKFAFIGAQSVGKTTMTNIFRHRFADNPDVAILNEGARVFFESHPDITDRSVDVQERIQRFVLEREKKAYQSRTKLIIADRSVIDPIVLTQIWDTPENAARLLRNVTDWLPTYTSFILLNPSGVPSVPEPDRRETPAERLAIHDAFREFCIKNGLPVVEVSGTLQERAERVEEVIFEHFPNKTILEDSRPSYTISHHSSTTKDADEIPDGDLTENEKLAIIGGGFAGLCVMSHLIQEITDKGQRVRITLFEPNNVDEGVPYNTALPPSFRLNHEADSMGIVNPFSKGANYDDFYQWIQENKDGELGILNGDSLANRYQDFDLSDPNAYLPRSLYGYYLKDRFEALLAQRETEDYRFTHRKSVVTSITKDEDGFTVFERDTSSRFSNVVLCTGDYFDRSETNMFYASNPHEYLANPDMTPTDEIGILGSSLSAIETAITLAERGYENITMFSRAGRLPKIRGKTSEYEPTSINPNNIEALRDDSGMIDSHMLTQLFKKEFDHAHATSNKGLYQERGVNWQEIIHNGHPLQQLDEDIRAAQLGEDMLWRSVLASTRGVQPDLWDSLSTQDCQQILQRYTSLILSYFAPMPLIQAEKLQTYLKTERIKLRSNIIRYEPNDHKWTIYFKDNNEVPIDHLIDARGYSQDASQNPLVTSLINGGLVEKHPINGIRANKQSQITKGGEPVDNLYAIGALLYGERPLNTATPSITQFAKEIAAQVAENI